MSERDPRMSDGFTLIELIVASALMLVVSALVFTTAIVSQRAQRTAVAGVNLSEQARFTMNRLGRELREAESLTAVSNVQGVTYNGDDDASFTFVWQPSGVGPLETVTYTYDRSAKQLVLSAGLESEPVLAYDVDAFEVTLGSSHWAADGYTSCGNLDVTQADGVVTWEELDAANGEFGDCDGQVTAVELQYIDSVALRMVVVAGDQKQEYQTRIDLRNQQ